MFIIEVLVVLIVVVVVLWAVAAITGKLLFGPWIK